MNSLDLQIQLMVVFDVVSAKVLYSYSKLETMFYHLKCSFAGKLFVDSVDRVKVSCSQRNSVEFIIHILRNRFI